MKKNDKKATSNPGLKFINLNTYTSPEIIEDKNQEWVSYGADNDYYGYLNDLFNGSPTNSAAINGIAQLIAGRGLDATDSAENPNGYAVMKKLFTDDCLHKIAIDLKLFGQASVQVIYNEERTQIVQVEHFPIETLRAERCNDDGEIEAYYYSSDWADVKNTKDLKRIPAFGMSTADIEILCIKPYKPGYYYYSPVDYQGATQYIEMESEISNFHLNSLLNGMAPSLLMNMNSGIPDEQTQREIEQKIYSKYTGTSNAGRIILAFNNGAEEQATVETIQLSDAHQQYQFLSEESSQKIIIGHRITSPMLLGIKNNTGLGSNAEELASASILFDNTVIRPFQDLILKAFDAILSFNDVSLKLYIKTLQPLEFIDLENARTTDEVEEQTGQKLSSQNCGCKTELKDADDPCQTGYEQIGMKNKDGKQVPNCVPMSAADEIREKLYENLMQLGEDEDLENWHLIDARPANEYDQAIHNAVNLASVVKSTPSKKSDQDTSILKVRYAYMGNNNPQRDFCQKMWAAKKIYRVEDLDSDNPNYNGNANGVNPGLGLDGADNYNIFLYKGGVNCRHYFERRTYLRKNNRRITVTEAIKRVNELDPSLRSEARIIKNPKEVAQIAGPQNNYWRK
ncbi:MAG: phage portal protein [Flavobacteriia bacterium]|nr:phage portal protein [Flavobacteriia bacterium]